MPLANTATRYGTLSKSMHWLTALLIVTLIPLGIIANGLPFETSEELARKARLFSIHKTLGLFVFFLALTRIAWAMRQPKPAPLHPERRLEHFAAETVHWLLYGSLVLVPLSGWIHHAATTGFAPIWWPFGQSLFFVPKDESVAHVFAGLHVIFERVLIFSLLLHVAGALKHHVIDKDATLRRMWFGRTEAGSPGDRHSNLPPVAGALAAWAVAILIGANLGLLKAHDTAPAAEALAAVESEWQVESGQLEITVLQLGSRVTGSFADWTAAIRFDETETINTAGDVDVTISIPSLTLGSVTSQALGPDFFNAGEFPTASFTGPIEQGLDGGYVVRGELTLRGATMPVDLPFDLQIDGDTAQMTAAVTLNRLDFGIGVTQNVESTLGFSVDVTINLTATRGAPSS